MGAYRYMYTCITTCTVMDRDKLSFRYSVHLHVHLKSMLLQAPAEQVRNHCSQTTYMWGIMCKTTFKIGGSIFILV